MNATTDEFVAISPEILYFGTPVAVISSLNSNGTTNLAAMSSFWALGNRFMLGLTRFGQTWQNLQRTPECVLNMPSPLEENQTLGPAFEYLSLPGRTAAGLVYPQRRGAESGDTAARR